MFTSMDFQVGLKSYKNFDYIGFFPEQNNQHPHYFI